MTRAGEQLISDGLWLAVLIHYRRCLALHRDPRQAPRLPPRSAWRETWTRGDPDLPTASVPGRGRIHFWRWPDGTIRDLPPGPRDR